jgi:hypothetical protein
MVCNDFCVGEINAVFYRDHFTHPTTTTTTTDIINQSLSCCLDLSNWFGKQSSPIREGLAFAMVDSNDQNPYHSPTTSCDVEGLHQPQREGTTFAAIVVAIIIGLLHWPIANYLFNYDWLASATYFFLGGVVTAVISELVGRFAFVPLYVGAYVFLFPFYATLDPLAPLALVVGLVLVLPAILGYVLVRILRRTSPVTKSVKG